MICSLQCLNVTSARVRDVYCGLLDIRNASGKAVSFCITLANLSLLQIFMVMVSFNSTSSLLETNAGK